MYKRQYPEIDTITVVHSWVPDRLDGDALKDRDQECRKRPQGYKSPNSNRGPAYFFPGENDDVQAQDAELDKGKGNTVKDFTGDVDLVACTRQPDLW